MDLNFVVFQEPRGVMRIIQFIFSICAFATTCNYVGFVNFDCMVPFMFNYEYPFNLELNKAEMNRETNSSCKPKATIAGNFSSDAKFFVAAGVIAMLYCIVILIVYTKFDQMYKTNNNVPLADFLLSVFISVLWLSSSASWAHALSGLKDITDPQNIVWDNDLTHCAKECTITTSSFSSLNISVVLGFLNFFLWAADLWFLYKETSWFQNARVPTPEEN